MSSNSTSNLMTVSENPLPSPRRIVTGHNSDGTATILQDSRFPTEVVRKTSTGGVAFSVLWRTETSPADNNDPRDPTLTRTLNLSNASGSVFRVVDFPPNHDGDEAIMHRTLSLDYGIVILGEIVSKYDDGTETVLHAGDMCVQRGTMHAWINRSSQWARMYFVLLGKEYIDKSTS